ncbi:hypothetical protein LCGC14_1753540 [marine sediment metagenome]|uniref:Uncharacterized protein n=1 Tax=marine sediment metagenome TaxID=412755 RepID=A0A0F9H355_9ZZZZ
MKVKIVDKKEVVKEMTIEELEQKKHVGFVSKESPELKFMLVRPICEGYAFVTGNAERYGDIDGKFKILSKLMFKGTFHIFDTARELYLWMAE